MAAWAKGVPCLLSLLQEGEEDDKDEEEEADSGLGEEEDELEVDVGDNEEPVEVPRGEQEEDRSSNEELTHVTLMYEVGSRSEAKVGHYETLDIDRSITKHLDKNKDRLDEARERVEREAEERKDSEDIVNFVREQEQAKIQSWVRQQTTMDKKDEQEIYKDYRSPFIFRWPPVKHVLLKVKLCDREFAGFSLDQIEEVTRARQDKRKEQGRALRIDKKLQVAIFLLSLHADKKNAGAAIT